MGERVEDGGPIHPIPEVRDVDGNGIMAGWNGMSLRDWFAGQVIASAQTLPGVADFEYRAKLAYAQADAMLKARSPSQESSRG